MNESMEIAQRHHNALEEQKSKLNASR
jgi:hypothetical protein